MTTSSLRQSTRVAVFLAAALVLCTTLTGCLVAGYSSGSGFWMWPGSIVLTIILLLLFLLRRR